MKERIKSRDGGRSKKFWCEKKSKMSLDGTCFVSKSAKIWRGGPFPLTPLVPPALPMKERIKSRDLILLEDEDDTAPFITGQCGCFELLLAPIHSTASCIIVV